MPPQTVVTARRSHLFSAQTDLMESTPIIDAHVHLWDQRRTPRPGSALVKLLGWHRGTLMWGARRLFPKPALMFYGKPDYALADYLESDFEVDSAGRVQGYVHVEAAWTAKGPLGPVGETVWLESRNDPKLMGIVGHADLGLGEAVGDVLAAHAEASPRFRGIRQLLYTHPLKSIHAEGDRPHMTREAEWRKGYAQLEQR
ncbi:MAG: L-fuconolactonase, partial [Rhodothermales bacterium]